MVVISTVFVFGAVCLLAKLGVLQSIKLLSHKHEGLGSVSNPKSGIWCMLMLGGPQDPWDSLASQMSINSKAQVLMRDPGSKSKVGSD